MDGPLARYPLARVLFLAHRCRASGQLRLFDGENSNTFLLREGAVTEAEGVPTPLGSLQGSIAEDLPLEQAIGQAMAQGIRLEEVLDEVSKSIARALAAWCLTDIGILSFKLADQPGGQAFRLPWNLVTMLSHGLHLAGSAEQGERLLEAQPLDPISVLLPADPNEQRLGLDSLALRVLNLARANPPLQDLVARATRGNSARRREVLHRVFLLTQLGLLHMPEPTLLTDEETQRVTRHRPRTRRVDSQELRRSRPPERPAGGEKRQTAPPEPSPEQQAAKLRKRIEILEGQNYFQRLGLGDAKELPTPEQIDEAFHNLSRRYHPDAVGKAGPAVHKVAEELFALLSEAVDGLRKRRMADEHWERNLCYQQGIPYVTERDRTKAKMSFKKGERLFRNRDYAIAEACFHEAAIKDPSSPLYTFMHAYAAFLAKQMPADEALQVIRKLTPETQQQASEFHYTIGRILLLSGGSKEEATACFDKAIAADPENRDAQRELRLHSMRAETKPKATSTFGSFLDRFRRKDKNGE